MCLTVKSNKLIAETDIVCYKHVIYNKGKLKSSYIKSTVNLGKKYQSIIKIKFYEIHKALHSFSDYNSAYFDANDEFNRAKNDGWDRSYAIIECIIPKGSTYYKGIFISGNYSDCSIALPSLASNKLIYGKIIIKIIEND
jgi:hypothetical protein